MQRRGSTVKASCGSRMRHAVHSTWLGFISHKPSPNEDTAVDHVFEHQRLKAGKWLTTHMQLFSIRCPHYKATGVKEVE